MQFSARAMQSLFGCSFAVFLVVWSECQAGPIHDAVAASDPAALEQVLSGGAELEESDWVVGTPLHFATSRGDIGAARMLLEHGADPNAISELRGAPALSIAAAFGDTEMIELLLEHGANLELRDHDGSTPLMRAAQEGMTKAVKVLADYGAEIDARRTASGATPLISAAENGFLATVQALIKAGAEVDALDNSGYSALMLAAQLQSFSNVGDGSLIKFLISVGADPLRKNEFGQTPREYAQSRAAPAWENIAAILKEIESNN